MDSESAVTSKTSVATANIRAGRRIRDLESAAMRNNFEPTFMIKLP